MALERCRLERESSIVFFWLESCRLRVDGKTLTACICDLLEFEKSNFVQEIHRLSTLEQSQCRSKTRFILQMKKSAIFNAKR